MTADADYLPLPPSQALAPSFASCRLTREVTVSSSNFSARGKCLCLGSTAEWSGRQRRVIFCYNEDRGVGERSLHIVK